MKYTQKKKNKKKKKEIWKVTKSSGEWGGLPSVGRQAESSGESLHVGRLLNNINNIYIYI